MSAAALARQDAGFTIVELLVALLIFGMLAAAGVALLTFSVRAQETANLRLGELGGIRRASAMLNADFAQAAPRIARDESGDARPAFRGGPGGDGVMVELVRGGWDNVDGSSRSSLQKVEYVVAGGRLERRAWRYVDGAAALAPALLLEGVTNARLRYRDSEGGWRERWDPARPTDLPRAVELTVDVARYGRLRQVFLVGAGT